jgi:hypothetical protein
MRPEHSKYTLPAGVCSVTEGCDTPNITVFSAVTKEDSNGDLVTPDAGRLQFVFDDPAPVVNSTSPYEVDQFTLTTTQNGQTSCPVVWHQGGERQPGWWQTGVDAGAEDGIPACDITSVSVYELTPVAGNFECMETGVVTSIQNAGNLSCPVASTPPVLEPSGYEIGAGLIWSITAEYGGEGAYGASYSAPQALTETEP